MFRFFLAALVIITVSACGDSPAGPTPQPRCQAADSMTVHNQMAGSGMDSLAVCVAVSMG